MKSRTDPAVAAWKDVHCLLSARRVRVMLLLSGLIFPQVILYGPSLIGSKILLPLNILASPGNYLPTPAEPDLSNHALTDEVLLGAPLNEYVAKQVRSGHLPLWNPENFAGAPLATFPKYSPTFLIYCCWPFPITLAYLQLIKSVVAGVGAYLFFRRALGVDFWPALIGAWCYPLTGFFIQWQGYGLSQVASYFPWILLGVYLTVREPKGLGPLLLVISTALALLVGQLDVAGLALLSSGLYAISCLMEMTEWRKLSRNTIMSVARLSLCWGLGLCIATAYVIPLIEYSRTGERFARRAAGEEERPPEGIAALPQIVLPNLYGSTQKGSIRTAERVQLESSAAGYAGLLASLLLAPLAFCHRELKVRSYWWLGFLVLSVGWVLDLPGLVQLMRMPGANTFSWNRWMILTGFALTVLAVIGLDAIMKGMAERRLWFGFPALLAAAVCAWCLYRIGNLPEQVLSFVNQAADAPAGAEMWGLPAPQVAAMVQSYFVFFYGVGAAFGASTLIGWGVLSSGMRIRGWMVAVTAALMLAELLIYGYDVNPQCDRALYYPPLAALEELKQRPPGRILCVGCLRPELNLMLGLSDIRGYDAVDPKRLLDILELARTPGTSSPSYAETQDFVPQGSFADDGSLRLPPVLSMLNVRYLIWSRDLPKNVKTIIRRDGYDVVENEHALPRTFVPRTIQLVRDDRELVDRLRDEKFDAAGISYVGDPVQLPPECRGTSKIAEESSELVTLDAQMQTAGIVVLADLWDKGWRARVDGQETPILVVNHAIRGVVVPPGVHRVIFRYKPESVRVGWLLSAAALLATLGWLACILVWRRNRYQTLL